MHQALYRKWRPSTFDEVVGQKHITELLKYEVANGKVSHAYLFCGSRGTGKTTCAKILAKAVNCLAPVNGNPCGKCEACRLADSGNATDILEMDAASNTGVDYIRDIRGEVVYAPSALKTRVYIIDEVHMLTDSAFNALLKTLEEPPENVIFILATTEMQKIPATILSRCQRMDFRRLPSKVISDRLSVIASAEKISLDSEAAHLIARLSFGGMRDAISMLELCSAGGLPVDRKRVNDVSGAPDNAMITKTVEAIVGRDVAGLFEIVRSVYMSSMDIGVFWSELMNCYRDMFVLRTVSGMDAEKLRRDILDVTESEFETLRALASKLSAETLLLDGKILEDAYISSIGRSGSDRRLCAEMTLVRMADGSLDTSNEALLSRIASLEDKVRELSLHGTPAAGVDNFAKSAQNECVSADENIKTEARTPEKEEADEKAAVNTASAVPEKKADEAGGREEFKGWPETVAAFAKASPSSASFLNSAGTYVTGDGTLHIVFEDEFPMQMITRNNELKTIAALASREDAGITACVAEVKKVKSSQRSLFDDPDLM